MGSGESQFIDAEAWDSITDPKHAPILNGAAVHVGVDLGVKSDSSAVVGVCYDPGGQKLKVAFHRIWKPQKNSPVNLDDVKTYIKEIHHSHRVRSISADPSQAYLLIQQLAREYITVKEFTQTSTNTIRMGETLFSLVKNGNLVAYKSAELREHVLNAIGTETGSGVRMLKGKSSRKIDAAILMAMALVSAVEAGPKVFNPRAVPISVGTGIGAEIRRLGIGASNMPNPYGEEQTEDDNPFSRNNRRNGIHEVFRFGFYTPTK